MSVTSSSNTLEPKSLTALEVLLMDEFEPEERLDRITRDAASLLEAPIARINLVTPEKLVFISVSGLPTSAGVERKGTFCSVTIDQEEVCIVNDAALDPRFNKHELVTGELGIRSYIGKSLHAPSGERIGTLCVFDIKPREYTAEQVSLLEDLSAWAEEEIAALLVLKST